MESKLAEYAGFCFGVKRAVDTVYEQVKNGKTIYTYGPIVHNEEVVKDLAARGVKVLESVQELMQLPDGDQKGGGPRVIIRAHGVSEEIYRILQEKKIDYVDATCPFVRRIQRKVLEESLAGKHIVIAGNAGHPEVEGIVGWCKGTVTVLENLQEAADFVLSDGKEDGKIGILTEKKICMVAQTTFNYNKFQDMVEIIGKRGYNVSVVNTICNATEERQRSARALALEADVMIVIGSRHSSNTTKLFEICSEVCAHTYFVQTLDDLHLALPKAVRLVGITAGASTPNKLIEEVQKYVRFNF